MFATTHTSPIREVLHWAEQAFFALLLLAGLGIAFYAVIAPQDVQAASSASVRLVEIDEDTISGDALAQSPSFHFNLAS